MMMRLCVALVLFIVHTHAFAGHHGFACSRSGPFRPYTKLLVATDQDLPNVTPSVPSSEASQVVVAAAADAAEIEIKNKAEADKEEAAARIAAETKKAAEEEAARIAAEQEVARIAAEQEAARVAAEQEAARIVATEKQEAARIAAEAERLAEAAIVAQKKEMEGKQRALLGARLSRDRIVFEKRSAYAQKLRARQAAVEEARSGTVESIAKYRALVDAQESVADKCFTVLCALGMHDTDDDVPDPDDEDYDMVHGHLDEKHISVESDFFWEVHAERYVHY